MDNIFKILREQIQDVLPNLKSEPILMNSSLSEMGISSIDRAQIIIQTLEQLNLPISFEQIAETKNIQELCKLLAQSTVND